MKDKLNILVKPFLLIALVLIVGYTGLNWLAFHVFNLFSAKEIITNFGIPAILSGIAVFWLMPPRLKLLKLKTKKGTWFDFYCFIAWVILTIPLFIAQEYMNTASGELTKLKSIRNINQLKATKYYTLKSHYIDNHMAGFHSTVDVSGKYNDKLNMHLYIVMPIFDSNADTLTDEVFAWLGVKYSETISNRLNPEEKEARYKAFIKQSKKAFANKNVPEFVYLDRIGNSDDRDAYIKAIRNNHVYKPNETILIGVDKPFEARNGKKLSWLLGSLVVGTVVWLIMVLIPPINKKHAARIKAGKPDKVAQREIREFFEFIKPKEGFFITPILIYLNVGIYVVMALFGLGFISFEGQDLVHLGANFGPLTKSGEWWRLLTCTFLHGGLMHLLTNMYGLLFGGIFLEPLLGRIKFLSVYLLTGVLASTTSILWYKATVSVGASGAIFGLYGVFLALLLQKFFAPDFTKAFLTSTLIFVGINLLMGLTEGIDNAAHIGGLVSGFVSGLILHQVLKRQQNAESV